MALAEVYTALRMPVKQKQLSAVQQNPVAQKATFTPAIVEAQSTLTRILTQKRPSPKHECGLESAYNDLTHVLRVVESGDRSIPAQAKAVFEESSQQAGECIREWNTFKQQQLPQLNQELRRANLAAITVAGVDQGTDLPMSH